MLSDKMLDALNAQINAEYFSAYLYQSMAAWFESEGLRGFARWMQLQAAEERMHGDKIFAYILDRGGRVKLAAIDAPEGEFQSPLSIFEATLDHERHITKRINDLVNQAIGEGDHATNNFLQWYVAEQVEEEATADDILSKLRLINGNPGGTFMLDRELGARQGG